MFSVVIPLYNKAHTIRETLAGVLSQDLTDFEVVIVDDGSTDGGPEIVGTEFADPRIRMLHQENSGVSTARNRGVAAARHELVAFLDGDDLWDPGYLTAMKEAAQQFPDAGMYCCAGTLRFPDGSGYTRYSSRYGVANQKINFFENPAFFGHTSATVVRKSRFESAGGFPVGMRHYEDQTLFYRLALLFDVVYCPRPLTMWRQGVAGSASSDTAGADRDRIARVNTAFACWAGFDPDKRNPLFLVYIRAEVRNHIRALLAARDYPGISLVLDTIDPRLRTEFRSFERFLYPKPALRAASRVWVLSCQAIWRSRGFPVRKFQARVAAQDPVRGQ